MERKAVDSIKSVLALENLREYQIKAVSNLLKGKDCFISQPTGSGKSAVYQLFPFASDAFHLLSSNDVDVESKIQDIVTSKSTNNKILVIQPLISLICDQKNKLESMGIKVCQLHSDYERESFVEDIENTLKDCSVILTSPEAVLNKYRNVLRRKEIRESIKCLAIDEGHCIVKWGSSSKRAKAFRSDYFNIAELRSILSGEDQVPVVVLTATATPDVEKQIIGNLQMNNVTRLVSPPDRPNIRYAVIRMKNNAEDQYFSWLIEELLNQGYHARRVIIFCRSHAHCRSLYKMFHVLLKSCNYTSYKDRPFAMFHAGIDDEIKSFILESFSKENGTVRVLFATTAFGMGVDCKGLNLVVHYGPPNDVDDYVQESGRAGRDNSKSHAVLLSYPRCTSGKVSESMKKYVKNTKLCRRKMLMQCFNAEFCYEICEYDCCDVCSPTDDCRFLSPFENNACHVPVQKKTTSNLSPETCLSREGKSILKEKLTELRNSCIEGSCNSFVGPDISSGFPLLAVEQIIDNVHLISNESSIWTETCILDTKLSAHIFEVIQNVRKHQEECTAESSQTSMPSCTDKDEKGNTSGDETDESENSGTDSDVDDQEISESGSSRRYRATFGPRSSDSSSE